MPVNSVHLWLKSILDGIIVPGSAGPLSCYIMPLPVRSDPTPAIYIWSSRGNEHRQSLPRAAAPYQPLGQSGWKEIAHQIDATITWFDSNSAPDVDSAFPAVVDVVLQILRSSTDPVYFFTDPLTGQQSELYGTGEQLVYDMPPPRLTADQRFVRFDATITIKVLEAFQS